MGILRDILDTFRAVDATGSVEDYMRQKKYSSISKRSTEGTMQFPVLVSRGLDVDTLQTITKALERQFASFAQIVLTMNPMLDLNKHKDAIGYLKQFHQNTDVKTDRWDVLNTASDIVKDHYECFASDDGRKLLFSITCDGSTMNIINDNKEMLKSVLEDLCIDKLNDKYLPGPQAVYKFTNENLTQYHNNQHEPTTEARNYVRRMQNRVSSPGSGARSTLRDINMVNQAINDEEKLGMQRDMHPLNIDNTIADTDNKRASTAYTNQKMRFEDEERDINRDNKLSDTENKRSSTTYTNQKMRHEAEDRGLDRADKLAGIRSKRASADKARSDIEMNKWKKDTELRGMDVKYAENVLKDNDVKKSNELVPTTLHIRVLIRDKDGNNYGFHDFIIGVKATMHPIESAEMVENVVAACKNSNKFFDFVRWTTGEISFFKDFVFNIKEIKDDVVKRSSGASHWWITLKRRKTLSKLKNAMMLPNQVLPNTSLVMSAQEVEMIKSIHGFDLMNPVFVDKVMGKYFLLSFVVVDTATQIAHFMFDGQGSYQSVTFNGLERENSAKLDTKEVLKLINKI